MIYKCVVILKIIILSADIITKSLLAALLLVTTTTHTYGMAMLFIMWLPAFLFIISYILRCGNENYRMSPSQMLLVLTLFPFLPIMMTVHISSSHTMKNYLVELQTFPCIVSCSLHVVLVLWCMLTAAIAIDSEYEGELYLN